MLSKWDSTRVVELQQRIKAVADPLLTRHEHYKSATTTMLTSVISHFFNEMNKDKILEVTQFVANNPDKAPVNQGFLQKRFASLDDFTQTILESGLGLEIDQDSDFFEFRHSEGLNPDAVELMNKMAIVLSACRVCIGIEQIYATILNSPHLKTDEYQHFGDEAKELKQKYYAGLSSGFADKSYLRSHYQQALFIQSRLNEQHIKVNAWKESFAEQLQRALASICQAIKSTGSKLIAARTAFPDKTWLGDGWRSLVTGLLSVLVNRYYSYSYVIGGELSLNLEYCVVLSSELSNFSLTMQDQMEHLKLALLDDADIELGDLIRHIQGQAALFQIDLAPKAQEGVYAGHNMHLFYSASVGQDAQRRYSAVQYVCSDHGFQ
ncbi:hypothetical protein [Legionella worsleiensis]|uniref:Coiled-coil protein n=1 Tax=Legionella worsleiensis TaxID=45076 RepID=A0A0W1AET1_9GAMM|nr:hypothetical protein [Legionella worsleiensis]KTD79806.1 coiled-coil protein [Legionella worsleiensis]STY32317.1 coiled-coil protein [Legionella worsleiensis]